MLHLIIGNKNYSSWSLRPWLVLKEFNIDFEEIKIPLYQAQSKQELLKYSPAGKVPVLHHGDIQMWDSLAICEYLADHHPELALWPEDKKQRALARSISHEMHSGFFELRNQLPMNCRTQIAIKQVDPALQEEVDRICGIWRDCREQFADYGIFLMGEFSIVDAMFAPIVLRFKSYGIKVGEKERLYMDAILALDSIQEWVSEGIKEPEVIPMCELDALPHTRK